MTDDAAITDDGPTVEDALTALGAHVEEQDAAATDLPTDVKNGEIPDPNGGTPTSGPAE